MGDRPLLPSVEELAILPSQTAETVIGLADRDSQRVHRYAMTGLLYGLLSFLACIGAYVALCILNHPAEAGAVLGVGVLNIVGRFISARK